MTSRPLSFCFVLPVFHSTVKLVVFKVFYGCDLISHWTAAHKSQFTALTAVTVVLLHSLTYLTCVVFRLNIY